MVDELLDRIGFTAAELRHPVELLTLDLVASRAGIPVTSLDSAVESAEAFRQGVLDVVVRSLDTAPGHASWSALRVSLSTVRGDREAGDRVGEVIQPLLAARAQELAEDPAFPLVLSAFDRFDAPELMLIARQVLRSVFREFWPFLVTVCDGSSIQCAEEPTPAVEAVVTVLLTADAYRRLLGAAALDRAQDYRLSGILADVLAAALRVEPSSPLPAAADWVLQDTIVDDRAASGRASAAKRAGAEILLGRELTFTTSIGVSEARRRTGLSNAGFYKAFGSVAELDRLILSRAHREIAEGFREEFFEATLADVRSVISPRR